jgi:hypothetical protein
MSDFAPYKQSLILYEELGFNESCYAVYSEHDQTRVYDKDSIREGNVYDLNTDLKRGFIEGAKWQAEKLIGELEKLILKYKEEQADSYDEFSDNVALGQRLGVEEAIEVIKKQY